MKWFLALVVVLGVATDPPRMENNARRVEITNAPRPSAKTRNVLIVGNSLTYFNEMPWMLVQIARSKNANPPLYVEFSGGSGMTLAQHWKSGKAARRIEEGRWDVVVLQAQSTEALRTTAAFEEHARRFDALIRAKKARTVILGTWAPRSSTYSQQQFDDEYEKTARRLGATLAPVGRAWAALQARGINLFEDDTHPNVAGSYLVACVLYGVAYGASPAGATHTFDVHFDVREFYRRSLENDRIDKATAAAIQEAAYHAVPRRRAR